MPSSPPRPVLFNAYIDAVVLEIEGLPPLSEGGFHKKIFSKAIRWFCAR